MKKIENLIAVIEASREFLRPSEDRLALCVLENPSRILDMTMDEFALAAKVSAPTVARFCAAIGCSGFREFKIRLAQYYPYGLPLIDPDVTPADSSPEVVRKVFNRTMEELLNVRDMSEKLDFDAPVTCLAEAERIEFYGSGNSGIVAADLQHKFFRLGIPTVAYADPHVYCMSALTLQKNDAVILISKSGRNRDILEAAENARSAGASVIVITQPDSPLVRLADYVIPAKIAENSDIYAPMTSRIAHLVLGDVLAVMVACRKGDEVRKHLEKAKTAVRKRRELSES